MKMVMRFFKSEVSRTNEHKATGYVGFPNEMSGVSQNSPIIHNGVRCFTSCSGVGYVMRSQMNSVSGIDHMNGICYDTSKIAGLY